MKITKGLLIKAVLGLMIFLSVVFTGCDWQKQQPLPEQEAVEKHESEQVILTPEAERLAGIKIEELGEMGLSPELKVPGEVVINPKKFYRLTARISGRVEQLLVYEGDRVKKGQVVVKLFSLPYLESLTELKLAKERLERLEKLGTEETSDARRFLNSAKEKLRIIGLTESDLTSLLSAPSLPDLYEVHSPTDGQVVSSKLHPGENLEAGSQIMDIASFDPLWVEARVQEKDLGYIKENQEAVIRAEAYPGIEFKGRVTFISPILDAATRTLKARVEVANPSLKLKPGMYVDVFLFGPEQKILAVPEEAVQEINGQQVVFWPKANGVYQVREIRTGQPIKGWLPVLSGLTAAEKYVSKGAFMLKAELLKHTLGEEGHHHD